MTPPRIAILTPLYGHSAFIADMLRSLVAQSFKNWECVVVLDGPDEAAFLAASGIEDDRIKILAFDRRRGVSACRNEAVRQTTAPWLLPFDADDLMDPEYLRELLQTVGQLDVSQYDKRWPVAYASARCQQPNGAISVFQYPPFNPDRFTEEFQIPNTALHPRVIWEILGGWDETWTEGAEDWHYWTRAVAKGLILSVNIPFAMWTYREHGGHRHSRVGRANWQEHKQVLDQILGDARKARRPAPETTRQAPPAVLGPPPPIRRAPGGASEPPDRDRKPRETP